MEKPSFVDVEQASKDVGISPACLRGLKAQGRLKPGTHWIYRSGVRRSRVGWNVIAIKTWQIEESKKIVDLPNQRAEAIETYASGEA